MKGNPITRSGGQNREKMKRKGRDEMPDPPMKRRKKCDQGNIENDPHKIQEELSKCSSAQYREDETSECGLTQSGCRAKEGEDKQPECGPAQSECEKKTTKRDKNEDEKNECGTAQSGQRGIENNPGGGQKDQVCEFKPMEMPRPKPKKKDNYKQLSQTLKKWLVREKNAEKTGCGITDVNNVETGCGNEMDNRKENEFLYQYAEEYEMCRIGTSGKVRGVECGKLGKNYDKANTKIESETERQESDPIVCGVLGPGRGKTDDGRVNIPKLSVKQKYDPEVRNVPPREKTKGLCYQVQCGKPKFDTETRVCRDVCTKGLKNFECRSNQTDPKLKQELTNQKRKLEEQINIQEQKRRKKEEPEGGKDDKIGRYSSEKGYIADWIRRKGGNLPQIVKPKIKSEKTPEIKKIKFKKKTETTLKGVSSKRGEMGENIMKITSFFETIEDQSKFDDGKVEKVKNCADNAPKCCPAQPIATDGAQRGGLSTRRKFTAGSGGGEGMPVLEKRVGGTSELS